MPSSVWGESITRRDDVMALFDPDQSSSVWCVRRYSPQARCHVALADPSKSLAGSDKHSATTLPMYVVAAVGIRERRRPWISGRFFRGWMSLRS
jgi:hypothetical protein